MREVAALDEERGSASSFALGWTGRVDWTRADQNSLPSCHRRAAQAGGPESDGRQAASEQVGLEAVAAATGEDALGYVHPHARGAHQDADCQYRCCD